MKRPIHPKMYSILFVLILVFNACETEKASPTTKKTNMKKTNTKKTLSTDDFVFGIDTKQEGASENNQYTLSLDSGARCEVDWNNDGVFDEHVNGGLAVTHSFKVPGPQTIRIKGTLPSISCAKPDGKKILSIKQWGTNPWTTMRNAFADCNVEVVAADTPNLEKVSDMSAMFANNRSLNGLRANWNWDTSHVKNMSSMFLNTMFDQDIRNWDTSKVTNFSSMFERSPFNQNIGKWNTSNVSDMSKMFENATTFNQDIGNWDTSKVENMSGMFHGAEAFNQNIGKWNTANVTNMSKMFEHTPAFNQDIGKWNTAKVENMTKMFHQAKVFNQDIGNWNTANVTNMSRMFWAAAAFNQNVGKWNVAKVKDMSKMFEGADHFRQDIGNWKIEGKKTKP